MLPVIRIENLSKSYRIQHGAAHGAYRTLRESLSAAATWPLRKLQGKVNGSVEEFWALKDVNLEVQQGEVLGIIGRNGAGKSTLLKILSRITAPTAGRVELRGRIGSLLEVGTGFHPELTGRENVYLNGSILGMSRREIQTKFDEIVEFSGVEKFLDTPVKRYSSGMYVRLAFAVAAHLEPEILAIDEVLAVGDAEFQRKCLGKMQDVAGHGRTVIFVSHNLSMIRQLCSRCIVLRQGAVGSDTDPASALIAYTHELERPSFQNTFAGSNVFIRWAGLVHFTEAGNLVYRGDSLAVELEVENRGPQFDVALGVSIEAESLVRLIGNYTLNNGQRFICRTGRNRYRLSIPSLPLIQGMYFVTLAIHDGHNGTTIDRHNQCFTFEVVEPPSDVPGRKNERATVLWLARPIGLRSRHSDDERKALS